MLNPHKWVHHLKPTTCLPIVVSCHTKNRVEKNGILKHSYSYTAICCQESLLVHWYFKKEQKITFKEQELWIKRYP